MSKPLPIVEHLVIELPVELTNGNDGRTKHFGASAKRRREFEGVLNWLHPKKRVRTPCRIHLVRVLGRGQRLWDADSILRGSAKELIDAVVAVGVIPDDGPAFVVEVTASQDAGRRGEGPFTVIELTSLEARNAD